MDSTIIKIGNEQEEKHSFREIIEPLLVIFNYASNKVLPNKEFYIAYSIPGGVYGYYKDHELDATDINKLLSYMRDALANSKEYKKNTLDKAQTLEYFEESNRKDLVKLLKSAPYTSNPYMRIGEYGGIGELFLNDIMLHLDKLLSISLVKFRKGFVLIADSEFFKRATPIDLEKSKYVKRFDELEECMKHHQIAEISELNKIISSGELSEFIKISEEFQSKKISRIADKIVEDQRNPRLVFIAGPTSSGKTTFAYRLGIGLKVLQKKVLKLSLDNYYLPHDQIPIDPETGMQNFEVISSLDLALFRDNITRLLKGEEVFLPRYNFNKGGHVIDENPTVIDQNTYVIVEGIHGLNPEMWQNIDSIESYRIYISALNTLNIHDHLPLSTSDHRLIRRLVRDSLFRGYDFNETIRRWPDVMKSEHYNIFPFQESAHTIINSALVYELAVFAHFAPKVLHIEKSENETIKREVERLYRLLSLFVPVNPTDIPPTSILREFIGGSSFKY